ncbi:MAG: DUF188 domain-containing protein [Lachnospirales bacterium]
MRILIDADSCPVINETKKIANKYSIDVLLFSNINHNLEKYDLPTIISDSSKEQTDINLINHSAKGDLVITNDIGLASLALGKGCICIKHNGMIFTENNILSLLATRHISRKQRKMGDYKNHFKFNYTSDISFNASLENIIVKELKLDVQ